MNGQSSQRFAAGDQQLAAGGEGRDMGTAGEAQSDLRLAISNYLPEGRGNGWWRAGSGRFAAGDEQLSAGREGRDMDGAAGEAQGDLQLATINK